MTGGDLLCTIDELLAEADPDGTNAARLRRCRQLVAEKVMLGAGDRAFIARMVAALDNVECALLTNAGGCRAPRGGRCEFASDYQACGDYERPQDTHRAGRKMLGAIGGTHA